MTRQRVGLMRATSYTFYQTLDAFRRSSLPVVVADHSFVAIVKPKHHQTILLFIVCRVPKADRNDARLVSNVFDMVSNLGPFHLRYNYNS